MTTRPEASLNRTMQELQRGVDPEVLHDMGYEVPSQYLRIAEDSGETAVAAVGPEIPEDVRAELEKVRATLPEPEQRTDNRHITLGFGRGRGAL